MPNSINVRGITTAQGTSTSHQVGVTNEGNLNADWALENNVFAMRFRETENQSTITSIRTFPFLSLSTEDFTYTKFKFIQE